MHLFHAISKGTADYFIKLKIQIDILYYLKILIKESISYYFNTLWSAEERRR